MLKQSIHVILILTFLELLQDSRSYESHEIYAKQYDSVIFDCIINTTGMPKWKHGGDILFLGKHALGTHSREGIQLSGNYSLIINPVLLSDEGVYECTASGSATVEKYTLTVIVPASPFVTIEGRNGTNLVYVEEKEAFVAVCHAVGSKPAAKISWCLNGDMLNKSKANMSISINSQNNRTFDSVSTTEHRPHEPTGNITCIAYGSGWTQQQATLMFATFVNPKIYLSINGIRSKIDIQVSEDQETNIICSAKGARPKVKLVVRVNDTPVEFSDEIIVPSVDINNIQTFDTIVEVSLVLPERNGIITCETVGQVLQESFVSASYIKRGKKDNFKFYMAIVSSGICVGVFLVAGLCIFKYCKGSKETDTQMSSPNTFRSGSNHQTDDEYLMPALSGKGISNSFCSSDRQGFSSLENRLTLLNLDCPGPCLEYDSKDFRKMDTNPQNFELPALPLSDDMDYGDYTTLPDNVYYSKSITLGAREKIFQRKDICFIVNMKKGDMYDRWMGTIAIPNKTNKCVVISTLIDKLLRTKEIHWDMYVKGLIELPNKATNIVRCEGICIDSGHLFLLQEHMTCENLETYIKTYCSKFNPNVNNVTDQRRLAQFCVDTMKGLEYLHSYGFLHPGLSTKKILLTSDGNCKLYDFCLKDDSYAIVVILKARTTFSLNTLPPESIMRNEYSRESDMWALAVAIWEIISFGTHPFPEGEDKAGICNIESKRPTNWPERYFPFRQKSLIFDCWSEDFALRPVLKLLKEAFEEVLRPKSLNDPVCTETNIYSSMEESRA